MRTPRRNDALVVALYINATLLFGILVAMLTGGRGPSFSSEAFAVPPAPQPIAGGSGIYVMPAQFTSKLWGCYLMDVDAQTLCVYGYDERDKKIRLIAARSFRNDRKLHDFNTDNPTPDEVAKLFELEKAGRRDKPEPGEEPAPKAAAPSDDPGAAK
jgi:hypothetical protein